MSGQAICVFCGSARGTDPRHAALAEEIGTLIANRGITLVYGGASVGLMGIVADAALSRGGRVVGVIPRLLSRREVAHRGLTEFIEVDTLAERKQIMADRSDAFLVLPGGIGTLDELFEMWSWTLLGVHAKPCAVLNAGGHFDGIEAWLRRSTADGFIRSPAASWASFLPGVAAVDSWLSASLTVPRSPSGYEFVSH